MYERNFLKSLPDKNQVNNQKPIKQLNIGFCFAGKYCENFTEIFFVKIVLKMFVQKHFSVVFQTRMLDADAFGYTDLKLPIENLCLKPIDRKLYIENV